MILFNEVTCYILWTSQQGFEKYFSLASEPASSFLLSIHRQTAFKTIV